MFKYQELIERLSIKEVNSTIKKMVDTYDLTGKFYESSWDKERTFKKYFNLPPDFLELLESMVQEDGDELNMLDLYGKDRTSSQEIYGSLLQYFELEARRVQDNREYLRIPVGSKVDFDSCMLHNSYISKVEFYKDGGWGIAEEDGLVIVKNHMVRQPSKTHSLLYGSSYLSNDIIKSCPYRIIQDRDTGKYGVLSYESFHETVHCLYEEIEFDYNYSEHHFYIKAKKNGKWGCFDERCALIIDFEYEIIEIVSGFLECIRGAEYLLNESLSERDRRYEVEGKRDLYDNEGTLLIGGYDDLIVDYQYLKFYFDTSYEYYEEEETDFQGYPVPLSKVRLNFEKSKCLVLDKKFKTIISNGNGLFRMPKRHTFHSLDEVERFVPSGYLLRYGVDLSDYDTFIYLHSFYGEQYIVPYYIKEGFSSPEEQDNYIAAQAKAHEDHKKRLQALLGNEDKEPDIDKPFDYSESTKYLYENRQDLYVDDSLVTIIRLNGDKEILWIDYANEIVEKMFYPHIYRKGRKFGIFDHNGLKPALYDAITRDSPDHKIYVASLKYCCESNPSNYNNPNYIDWRHLYIQYYKLDEDGNYISVKDDWETFNPRNCKWIPYDFININYGDCDDGGYDYSDQGHEWTDEDAWDAMTDGMYGDYPGSGWDPEAFGY